MSHQPVYIVSAVRTPIGSFGGVFASLSAVDLGTSAVEGALSRSEIDASLIEEVFIGNVVSANLGQAPARQVALRCSVPDTVPCTTINKVCASGLKAIMIGAQSIMLGDRDIVIAGGMESMSQIPYYVPQGRFGYKFGSAQLIDGLVRDGLEDVYDQCAMGAFADATAQKYQLTREHQDAYAVQSYQRSTSATQEGRFSGEIVPVSVPQRKGDPMIVHEDEEYKKVKYEKIPALRPAFSPDGTVTAANASTINDGAAAVILCSEQALKIHNLKPLARIVAFGDAAQEPQWFTTAPAKGTPELLKKAGLTKNDIDYFEVNEAFSVVPLAFSKLLDIDTDRINVHGGAVSLGHPLGASGTRILATLSGVLRHREAKLGLATICNGGGGASSMIIEQL